MLRPIAEQGGFSAEAIDYTDLRDEPVARRDRLLARIEKLDWLRRVCAAGGRTHGFTEKLYCRRRTLMAKRFAFEQAPTARTKLLPHLIVCGTLQNLWQKAKHGMAVNDQEVQIGAQGRIVIPASLRKDLGLKPGDRLIARREGDCLILEPRSVIRNRLQQRFSTVPGDASLVDELIAERRREAQAEADSA